jgi:hypothetical protein
VETAISPFWVHDLLKLWRGNYHLHMLLEQAFDRTAQGVEGAEARRRTLGLIARYFVPVAGNGIKRRTVAPNVWAAYARGHSVQTLAPVYLANLIAHHAPAYLAAELLHTQHTVGDIVTTAGLRHALATQMGSKVAANTASAFLRTLHYWGVLAVESNPGAYRYAGRIPVTMPAFPLLVWVWRQHIPGGPIDLAHFGAHPLTTFLDSDSFGAHWAAYSSRLWRLQTEDGRAIAQLRPATMPALVRALLNLLSTGG